MADSEPPSSAPAGEQASQNLGQILRSARIAQDLSIEQLATELRIEAPQLTALEENRFEKIGVPVFVKGYLRQYGQRLGVDYRDLLALYYKQTKLEDVRVQPSPTIRLRDERQITVWVVAGVVLAVIVAGLAVWWVRGGRIDFASTTASVTSAVSPAAAPAVAPVPVPQAAPRAAPVAEPVVAPAAELPTADVVTDVAQAPPADALAAEVAPATVTATVTSTATAAITIPLEVTFDEESWAEVTDARGERLFYGLGAAGQRATLRGEPPFAIVLGNAGAVRLLVDGETYAIPTPGRQGSTVRFSVDIAEE
jgi:cytoskeleton protein RodZ